MEPPFSYNFPVEFHETTIFLCWFSRECTILSHLISASTGPSHPNCSHITRIFTGSPESPFFDHLELPETNVLMGKPQENPQENVGSMGFDGIYPLVNVYITMINHHFIAGKTHDFNGPVSIAMLNHQRVTSHQTRCSLQNTISGTSIYCVIDGNLYTLYTLDTLDTLNTLDTLDVYYIHSIHYMIYNIHYTIYIIYI